MITSRWKFTFRGQNFRPLGAINVTFLFGKSLQNLIHVISPSKAKENLLLIMSTFHTSPKNFLSRDLNDCQMNQVDPEIQRSARHRRCSWLFRTIVWKIVGIAIFLANDLHRPICFVTSHAQIARATFFFFALDIVRSQSITCFQVCVNKEILFRFFHSKKSLLSSQNLLHKLQHMLFIQSTSRCYGNEVCQLRINSNLSMRTC